MTPARLNPFRTEQLESLAFRPQGASWPQLMLDLSATNHRAAIVGPEGSGKTTLLEQLAVRLRQHGHRIRHVRVNACGKLWGCSSLMDWISTLTPEDTVLVDGADHLPRRAWRGLKRRSRPRRGLIVTSHRKGLLPTLISTRTSSMLLHDLVRELVDDTVFAQLGDQLPDTFRQHRGNLRTSLLSLYDIIAAR